MRAMVVSGSGRYADPWHAFPATSGALAEILTAAGLDAEVRHDVDAALQGLAGVDLLVVNAGDPWHHGETGRGAPAESIAGLEAAVARGIGILGVHAAAASLRDYPAWRAALGGSWTDGVSTHPPFGEAHVRVYADRHPIVDGARDLMLLDERYCRLEVDGDLTVLADHELEGERHPLLWARQVGRSRVCYSALGHDRRAYDSAPYRALLTRAARWLTGGR
jgi:type 1 glutamine amidotransferase